jgi:hypothetical protein
MTTRRTVAMRPFAYIFDRISASCVSTTLPISLRHPALLNRAASQAARMRSRQLSASWREINPLHRHQKKAPLYIALRSPLRIPYCEISVKMRQPDELSQATTALRKNTVSKLRIAWCYSYASEQKLCEPFFASLMLKDSLVCLDLSSERHCSNEFDSYHFRYLLDVFESCKPSRFKFHLECSSYSSWATANKGRSSLFSSVC